ncbi:MULTISPECIES: cysteine hydrolase [unclassified Streptomyces]|uniref:cysteine hydrolase n=1 Tax=unclassified Streptomyces TaxID=2593676 RepID=UPI002254AD81|nr:MULTISPECIES: cysteine hydrolase [unclassified Streptomyces]MCX4409525.1 cysteine hydrolase [Streptomyces sp. NBC_01764]MCX5191296.1 cysteine hydrolase [Streptomyces sp. NBC_00268]
MTSPKADLYAEPSQPALPGSGFRLEPARTALVVTDPQIDFLSPAGATWEIFGASITDNDTVLHIGQLLEAAKAADVTVAISPHYYYPSDDSWQFGGPLEQYMHNVGMFSRRGPLTLDGFDGSGADFLPAYREHILDGRTVVTSPHKIVGPESNDLVLQLRKRGVSQVLLAGMAANLCVEGHLRELVEQGFEVVVVRDATAGPRLPEGDGYLSALINFRYLAAATWTTAEAVEALTGSLAPSTHMKETTS